MIQSSHRWPFNYAIGIFSSLECFRSTLQFTLENSSWLSMSYGEWHLRRQYRRQSLILASPCVSCHPFPSELRDLYCFNFDLTIQDKSMEAKSMSSKENGMSHIYQWGNQPSFPASCHSDCDVSELGMKVVRWTFLEVGIEGSCDIEVVIRFIRRLWQVLVFALEYLT